MNPIGFRTSIASSLIALALTLNACASLPGLQAPTPTATLAPVPTNTAVSQPTPASVARTAVPTRTQTPVTTSASVRTVTPVPTIRTTAPRLQEVLLRLRFQPDEVRRYAHVMDITVEAPDGTRVAMQMQMRLRYRVVERHPDGSATLTATYESVALSANRQTREVHEMSGVGIRMRVAPDGTTSNVEMEKAPIGADGKVSAADFSTLSQIMRYPTNPLRIGDSFENKYSLAIPGYPAPVTAHSRVSLEELTTHVRKPAARLVETVVMPEIQLPLPEMQNVKATGKFDGKATHYVETESGWAISGNGSFIIDLAAKEPEKGKSVNLKMRLNVRYQEVR